MTMLASQITSLTVVYSIVYSGVNQRKHQSSASPAFVREIHRGPVNFPHKWPVTRKMFPFDDVIMILQWSIFFLVVITMPLFRSFLTFWNHQNTALPLNITLIWQVSLHFSRCYWIMVFWFDIIFNLLTAGKPSVTSQYCSIWCHVAKAPGHQNQQYWLNIGSTYLCLAACARTSAITVLTRQDYTSPHLP